jgi:hypothetical protein
MLGPSARGLLVAGLAVLAFGIALRAQHLSPAAAVVTEDGPYMLEPARDCVATHDCATRLSSLGITSRFGLPHGAAFLDLLIAVEAVGGGYRTVAIVLMVLAALSAVVVLAVGARVAGPLSGLAGAAVYVHYLTQVQTFDPTNLVNATLTPLPAALFVALSCAHAVTARIGYLLLAAVALGFGIQAHLAWTVCALVPVVLVALRGQGRRMALLAAVTLVTLASIQLLSPAMLMDTKFGASQLRAVAAGVPVQASAGPALGFVLVLVLGLGLALGLALLLGRAAPAPRPGRRDVLRFLLAGCLPVALVLGVLGRSASSYAYPAAPMIALMASVAIGEGSDRLGRALPRLLPRVAAGWGRVRRRATLVLALAAFGAGGWLAVDAWARAARADGRGLAGSSDSPRNRDAVQLTYDDARLLADHLAGTGWSFEDVYTHLRGLPSPHRLVSALAPYLPAAAAAHGEPARDDAGRDLVILPSPPGRCPGGPPADWTRLVASGGVEFHLATYAPWLRWGSFDACAWASAEPTVCRWRRVEHRFAPEAPESEWRRLYARQFLGGSAPELYRGDAILVRVPVRVPAEGAARLILVPPLDPPPDRGVGVRGRDPRERGPPDRRPPARGEPHPAPHRHAHRGRAAHPVARGRRAVPGRPERQLPARRRRAGPGQPRAPRGLRGLGAGSRRRRRRAAARERPGPGGRRAPALR